MKIVEIAFVLLIFNGCMAVVSHSAITDYPIYYEAEYIETFDPESGNLPDNLSASDEAQQYATTMDVFNIILTVTDFGWLYYLLPDEIEADFAIFIGVLQAIVGFFYIIALVELFVRQTKLLGK